MRCISTYIGNGCYFISTKYSKYICIYTSYRAYFYRLYTGCSKSLETVIRLTRSDKR